MKNRNPFKKLVLVITASLMPAVILQTGYAGGGTETPPQNRYFYIKSVQAGSQNLGYWDQPGVPKKFKKGDNLALYAKDKRSDQQFMFVKAGSGYYYIKSKNGGIVDVAGNKNNNGTNVLIWSGHGGPNQLFSFKHLGKGRWKIYAKNGSVICTPRNYKNGSNVHIWKDHNGPWMEWYLEDAITGKKYDPSLRKEAVKKVTRPDFMILNKDKAFNYTSETMVSRYTGKAFIASLGNRVTYMYITSTGINPNTNKKETVSRIMKIYYNSATEEYSDGSNDREFGLFGKADKNAGRLDMNHSQGGIRFEVTSNPKTSVIPDKPEFFLNNKSKSFEYKGETAFAGGSKGTATIKSIKGNEIILSLKRSYRDEKTGKDVTRTSDYKLYYINGCYSNNISDYPTLGVAAGSDKKIEISGMQSSDTFTVK